MSEKLAHASPSGPFSQSEMADYNISDVVTCSAYVEGATLRRNVVE